MTSFKIAKTWNILTKHDTSPNIFAFHLFVPVPPRDPSWPQLCWEVFWGRLHEENERFMYFVSHFLVFSFLPIYCLTWFTKLHAECWQLSGEEKKLKFVSISRQKEGAPLIWWSEEDMGRKSDKSKSKVQPLPFFGMQRIAQVWWQRNYFDSLHFKSR